MPRPTCPAGCRTACCPCCRCTIPRCCCAPAISRVRSDHTVATLIGDVAGHGPDEAAVAVALRAAWRGLVLSGHGPSALLDGLDKVLVSNRPSEEMFTTVCCTWISPDRALVTLALAGHPPPLLVRDGQVRMGEVPAGPALGIHDHGYAWEAGTLEVGDAWTLLCFTDGLVEGLRAPGSVERFGIDALVETFVELLDAGLDLDAILDGLLAAARSANGGELSDDVAILCCAQRPPVAVERIELSPHPSSPARARRFVDTFSARQALPGPVNDQLVLVSCELVTNAVLHAATPLTLQSRAPTRPGARQRQGPVVRAAGPSPSSTGRAHRPRPWPGRRGQPRVGRRPGRDRQGRLGRDRSACSSRLAPRPSTHEMAELLAEALTALGPLPPWRPSMLDPRRRYSAGVATRAARRSGRRRGRRRRSRPGGSERGG